MLAEQPAQIVGREIDARRLRSLHCIDFDTRRRIVGDDIATHGPIQERM